MDLDHIDRRLLDEFQRQFPLEPAPFRTVGEKLGIAEGEVLRRLARLQEGGAISRVGAVVAPHRTGWSTLAAMAVPPQRLAAVAEQISACPEVNHNYEREHHFNLWFVVTGHSREAVDGVIADIESETGLAILNLPLEEAYKLDLGFPLQWS